MAIHYERMKGDRDKKGLTRTKDKRATTGQHQVGGNSVFGSFLDQVYGKDFDRSIKPEAGGDIELYRYDLKGFCQRYLSHWFYAPFSETFHNDIFTLLS